MWLPLLLGWLYPETSVLRYTPKTSKHDLNGDLRWFYLVLIKFYKQDCHMARWNPKSTEKEMMMFSVCSKLGYPNPMAFTWLSWVNLWLWVYPMSDKAKSRFLFLYIPWNIANWFHDMSIIATLSHEDPMKRVFLIPWDLQINSILITNLGKTMP